MDLQGYLIVILFIIMGLALIIIAIPLSGKGISFMGAPTLRKFEFFSGKTALFTSWGLFIAKAVMDGAWPNTSLPVLTWIAVAILFLSAIILIISFKALGKALKVGLPAEETKLQTGGIYRFCRNPLYLGVFGVCLASCLYFPNPFNIILAAYGIFVHVRITLGEEKFLEERFGDEYRQYKRRVGRFL
jgi:protein-S-isoprenylcysteine O-methyltransferase Ste14